MYRQIKDVKINKIRRESFLISLKSKKNLLKFIVSFLIFRLVIYLATDSNIESLTRESYRVNPYDKVNACFFVLSRNQDLNDLIKTIEQIENAFNHNYNYPYVIVSDKEFTNYFKKQVKKHTNSIVQFGMIPKDQWSVPKWIDIKKLNASLENLELKKVFKGGLLSYHHMCRYYSGFFFRHSLTLKYDYYWRLDTHVKFPCHIKNDPFLILKKTNKLYGFTLTINEELNTMPSLWKKIQKFFDFPLTNQTNINNGLSFVSKNNGEILKSLCVFWNNFEIASFSVFRNKDYLDYFDYLDKSGGFYYERWGDAVVHTYYALTKLKVSQIERFKDIGYGHSGRYNWPRDKKTLKNCLKVYDDQHLPNCKQKWDDLAEKNLD